MIQRMQSLLLLLATGSIGTLLAFPFLRATEEVEQSDFLADGQYSVLDHPANMAAFGLAGLLALIAIFLFRNRKAQMRLTVTAMVLLVVAAVVAVVLLTQDVPNLTFDYAVGIGTFLPLLALILSGIAYRLIKKDEKLVRSMDRLR